MTDFDQESWTGGCLCGHLRYASAAPPNEVYACHCRYCQRHTGSALWAGAKFPQGALSFVGGKPAVYQSSKLLQRMFCKKCGSTVAIFYENPPWKEWEPGIEVAVGSLDNPRQVKPSFHYCVESQLEWLSFDDSVPAYRGDADPELQQAFTDTENRPNDD